MASIKFDITGDNSNFLNAMNGVQNSVRQTMNSVEQSGMSIETVFNRIAAVAGIAFSTAQIKSFADKVVETRAYFQDIESSMEVFLGSQQKAADFTSKLKDYAYYNMFEFSDLAAASKQMIAYHTEVDDVIPTLDKLSNIATGTKVPLMELVGMYNAARSTGYLGAQQLQSWATKGVLVRDTLKEMGVQTEKTGATFEQLNMVLDKLTGEGGMFHDLMLNQMENISAEQGQLEDNLAAMYNEIGEKYQDYITGVIKAESWLVDHYKEVGTVLLSLISSYGAYKAALVATRAAENVKRNINGSEEIKVLNQEIAAIMQARQAKGELISEDLKEAIANGQLSEEIAKVIEQRRRELALRVSKGELSEEDASIISQKEMTLALLKQEEDAVLNLKREKLNSINLEIDAGKQLLAQADDEIEKTRKLAEETERAWEKASEKYMPGESSDEESANVKALYEEKEAAALALSTLEEERNTLATELNTLSEQANALQTEIDTAATGANTAATGANTAAETANTAATRGNTIAQTLNSLRTRAATQVQLIFNAAVLQARLAMDSLKTAIMTNPLGILIGALSLIIPLLIQFFGSEEDAEEKTRRFGDSAAEASSKVESMFGVLDTVEKGSKVHKDTMNELTRAYEEYGVKLDESIMKGDDEKAKIDELIGKKKELISVIRSEAIERQAAEDIAAATDTYKENVEAVKKEIKDSLGDSWSEPAKNSLVENLISDEEIDKIREKLDKYSQTMERLKETFGDMAHRQPEARAALEEYNKEVEKVTDRVETLGKSLGVSSVDIRKAKDSVKDNVDTLVEHRRELVNTIDEVDKVRVAQLKASGALNDSTEKARLSKKTLGELKGVLDDLAKRSQIDIDVNVRYNEQNMPEVLKTFTSDQWRRRSAEYTRLAQNMGKGQKKKVYDTTTKTTKTYTQEELLEEAYRSTNEGTAKKKQEEAAAKEAERNAEAAKKSAESKAKEAARKAEQERKDAATRRLREVQEERKWAEEQQKIEQEAQDAIADARIASIKNSAERERAEQELEHLRNIRQIEEQAEELKKAVYEHNKSVWENQKENKDKHYETDSEAGRLGWQGVVLDGNSAGVQKIRAELEKENAEYARLIEERYKSERQASWEFLKQWGDLEQQKLAITQEYEEKIREAQSPAEAAGYALQRDSELERLSNERLLDSIDWDGVFNDLSNHSKEYLEGLRDQLQSLMSSGEVTDLTQLETLQGKIREINAAINEQGGMFQFASEQQREHIRRIQEANDAQKALNAAKMEEARASMEVYTATQALRNYLKTQGIDSDIDLDDELLTQFDEGSEEFKKMSDMLTRLKKAQVEYNKAGQESKKKLFEWKKAEDAADEGLRDSIARVAGNINEWCQQYLGELPALLDEIGLGSASEKVSQGLSAVNNAAGAAADFASGNYVGAALKAISAVKDFGRVLGIGGGNGEEVRKTLEELNHRNELLTDAIETLTETIGSSAGVKAISAANQALALQTEKEDNLRGKIGAQMGYHEAHHSFDYYWSGFSTTELQKINKTLKTINGEAEDWTGELSELTADQAKALLANADLVQKIEETGKGGYGERVLEYIRELAEESGRAEEITRQINDNLTQTSFDSLRSSFLDTLTDMESDSEDFANSFMEMMFKAMVNSQILDDEFEEWIKTWQKEYAEAVKNNNTDALADLRRKALEMRDTKVQERDLLAQTMGYGTDSGAAVKEDKSATLTSAEKITYEQADMIVGILTALQIAVEHGNDDRALVLESLSSLDEATRSNGSVVSGIRNLLVTTNMYLYDIKSATETMLDVFGTKLDRITNQLGEL